MSRSGKSRPDLALTQFCCKNLKEKGKSIKKVAFFVELCVFLAPSQENRDEFVF